MLRHPAPSPSRGDALTGALLPFPGTTPAARRHATALERFGVPWVDLEPAERLEVYRILDAEV